jgi:hypothetical protein
MVDDCDVGCGRITIAWNAFGNDVSCWRNPEVGRAKGRLLVLEKVAATSERGA